MTIRKSKIKRKKEELIERDETGGRKNPPRYIRQSIQKKETNEYGRAG